MAISRIEDNGISKRQHITGETLFRELNKFVTASDVSFIQKLKPDRECRAWSRPRGWLDAHWRVRQVISKVMMTGKRLCSTYTRFPRSAWYVVAMKNTRNLNLNLDVTGNGGMCSFQFPGSCDEFNTEKCAFTEDV